MLNYPLVAAKVMMKVKGYWPQASTDEPQVLALAELLQESKCSREEDALTAVTALAKTETAKRNDFRPTPAMLSEMTNAIRRDRHNQEKKSLPTGVNKDGTWYDSDTGRLAQEYDSSTGNFRDKVLASPHQRDQAINHIKGLGATMFDAAVIPDADDGDVERPRSDIGNFQYNVNHIERLTVESRRAGIPDTEDEIIQYRWSFDPPDSWHFHPICGPWVNTQSQAIQDGKAWLATANKKYR